MPVILPHPVSVLHKPLPTVFTYNFHFFIPGNEKTIPAAKQRIFSTIKRATADFANFYTHLFSFLLFLPDDIDAFIHTISVINLRLVFRPPRSIDC